MTQEDAFAALDYLRNTAETLGVSDMASAIFLDQRFLVWSGSSKPQQHHYGKHGLIIHTSEVVKLCLLNANALGLQIDVKVLYLAALYHDAGKMWDYQPIDVDLKDWEGTRHKRRIHHITRSVLFFQEAEQLQKTPLDDEFCDEIIHAILAHHGMREWGSPVAPHTKTAWLLHLCDGISARMNDADRLDRIK